MSVLAVANDRDNVGAGIAVVLFILVAVYIMWRNRGGTTR